LVDKQFIFSANYSAVNTTASIRRQASPADLVCRHRVDATLVGHALHRRTHVRHTMAWTSARPNV